MAAPAPTYDSILREIKAGHLADVYVLHGDEGYYTDAVVRAAQGIIPEEDKDFDENVVYALQYSAQDVITLCRQLPFASPRRVVIVKEAQAQRADWLDRLTPYIENPNPQCSLFIACRGAQAKGRKFTAAIKGSNCRVLLSKPVNESGAGVLIGQYMRQCGLKPEVQAIELMRDHVGTDLSRLYNEIDKLKAILPSGAPVTAADIERHVGVSRDYNSWQLVDALAAKDAKKVMQIARYFASNPKAVPVMMAIAAIYGLFSDLAICLFAADRSDRSLMNLLALKSPWPLRRLRQAMGNYNAWQVMEIMTALRQCDRQSKGIGSRADAYDILQQFLFRALTCDGHPPGM